VSNWAHGPIEQVQLRFILRRGLDDFRSASPVTHRHGERLVPRHESWNRRPAVVYNRLHHRRSPLFQGRFKAVLHDFFWRAWAYPPGLADSPALIFKRPADRSPAVVHRAWEA
jgi:hypothetical protein